MSIEVKVPQLPESVTDATLVSWHKQEGDRVSRDENLVDLETDKVVLEVPAPADGVLKEIRIGDGTTVTSGEVLALLEEGEGGGEPETGGETDASAGAEQESGDEKAAAQEKTATKDADEADGKDEKKDDDKEDKKG